MQLESQRGVEREWGKRHTWREAAKTFFKNDKWYQTTELRILAKLMKDKYKEAHM